jgi:hypothetical protein
MRISFILLIAALGACGQWRAAAGVVPPATNQTVLTWGSLGLGTQYYVQTSTDLLTWTAATNTTATNVSLAFTGDNARVFRLSASNAPPQSATLAWDAGAPSAGVAGYFLYYGTASRSYSNRVDLGLATSAVVTNLAVGTTYYFATTAYTSAGLESDFSNEAVWALQNPPQLRIRLLP